MAQSPCTPRLPTWSTAIMLRSTLALLVLLTAATAHAAEFHVAPSGSDDNPGTQAAPFATLERARDAVRTLKAKGPLSENLSHRRALKLVIIIC